MKKKVDGVPSVFRNKLDGKRVQGVMTKAGGQAFEMARRRLKVIAKPYASCARLTRISDGDVFEFLARGEAGTIVYLEKLNN